MNDALLLKLNSAMPVIDPALVETVKQIEGRRGPHTVSKYLATLQAIRTGPSVYRGRPRGRPRNPVVQNQYVVPTQKRLFEVILDSMPAGKHTLLECVNFAHQAGYKSTAKDFTNMVYQTLHKLVHKGLLQKYHEGRPGHGITKYQKVAKAR